jgi:hypothetical protein
MGIEPEENELSIELIHRQSTPYYPDWKVTIEEYGIEFFIGQDGTISH